MNKDDNDKAYEVLLKRIQTNLGDTAKKSAARLEVPVPQVMWVGRAHNIQEFHGISQSITERTGKDLTLPQ